jgi:hypothetical protein
MKKRIPQTVSSSFTDEPFQTFLDLLNEDSYANLHLIGRRALIAPM